MLLKFKGRRILPFFQKFIFFLCISNLSANTPQQWTFLNTNFHKSKTNELNLTLHTRILEGDTLSLYQIQPKYSFKLNEHFWGATNYSFFGVRQSRDNDDEAIVNQHRFEVELQPKFEFNNWKLSGRNRMEYLYTDDLEYINKRFRHRTVLQYDGFKKDFGSLVTQCEVFYDFGANKWNQFRTTPIGIKILNGKIGLLPTMLSNYRNDNWDNSFVAVLEINLAATK